MFAEVIVDISASDVDKVFTYLVPDGMNVSIGWQVAVPFGARVIEGFIIGLTEVCSLSPEKIKPILRPVRDYPVILPELVELAKWVKSRYLCNVVDALRLMIPSEMRGERVNDKKSRRARLILSDDELVAFISKNRRAKKQVDTLNLLRASDIDIVADNSVVIKALAEKGAVEIYDVDIRRTPTVLRDAVKTEDPELMPAQKLAVDEITGALSNGGGRFLLHGVTGSGKTEVYIRVARKVLEMGKTAIVLVPEIALTPQMVRWFHARFGADAAVIHSGLSAGERYDEWKRIRTGEARIIIGARSAVFAPAINIGLIVVDEEHEHTYRSDMRPRYDAREVAWRRAETQNAVLILGSATPSIETYMKAMPGVRPENKLTLIELNRRVMGRPLPEAEIIDMRSELEMGNHTIFSARLSSLMSQCLSENRQAMLFINRRGYSTFVSCRACGKSVKCPNCDVTLTYHMSENLLKCHYCGHIENPPATCPQCGSKYIKYFGTGTQKVEEAVSSMFPMAKVERLDNDTTSTKDAHIKILDRFRRGETNVLVGTQMITKGLDFPNVTLVGVIAADMSLNLPDYRSTERTFQLITQVAGRAGRAEHTGHVIIQTYDPEHYAITLAAKQDYRAFYLRESEFRRMCLYPPFTVIARIVFSSKSKELAIEASEKAKEELDLFIDENRQRRDVIQVRSVEAPINFLRGLHRYQVFMKMYFKGDIELVTAKMRDIADAHPPDVRAELEVNPVNMI